MKKLAFVFAAAVVLALSGAAGFAMVANAYEVTTLYGRPGYLTGRGPDNRTWSKVLVVVAGCDTDNTDHPLTGITINPEWSAISMSAITSTFGCTSRLPRSNHPKFPRRLSPRVERAGIYRQSCELSRVQDGPVQDSPMDKTTRQAHDEPIILCLPPVSLKPPGRHWGTGSGSNLPARPDGLEGLNEALS